MAEDFCADGGVGSGAIALANRSGDRLTANIVGAALIAEKRAAAAGASGVALRVATDGGGTGAGNEHDGGLLAGGIERELKIGDEAEFCVGKCVGEMAQHLFVGLGAANSGKAGAEGGDVADFDASFARGGLRGFGESGDRGLVTDAEGIGGAGTSGRSDLALGIEENAFGFAAATVEAQDVVHGERICDLGGCAEWSEGWVARSVRVAALVVDWWDGLTPQKRRRAAALHIVIAGVGGGGWRMSWVEWATPQKRRRGAALHIGPGWREFVDTFQFRECESAQ
jgi:hypothetical protein